MIWIIIAIITLVVLFGLGLLAGNYFYSIALDPKNGWYRRTGRKMIYANDLEQGGEITKTTDKQAAEAKHFYAKATQEVHVMSRDGLKLFGTVFEEHPRSNKWAILMHGYRSNGQADVGFVAMKLADLGFNSIVPDQRGHGKSSGNYIGMGWHERFDVLAWINHILERNPSAEIILYGGSMGASTVMNASGEALPKNVRLIIADCGYSSAAKEFRYLIKHALGVPIPRVIVFFANIITKLRSGHGLYKANTMKQLAKNRLPILFIHGVGDTFVPYTMTQDNMAATKSRKEALFVADAVHFSSYVYNPKLYFETVENFIDRNL